MARKTAKAIRFSNEQFERINDENKYLIGEFLQHLQGIDRTPGTIKGYKNDLKNFFCWNFVYNRDKEFAKMKARDFVKFQGFLLDKELSPKRIRRIRGAISSMCNFVEDILEDEEGYEGFKNFVRKVEAPANVAVRKKLILKDEQVEKLLNTLIEQGDYQKACAFAVGIASGSRKNEILRFKAEYFCDENIKAGSWYVTPEKMKTKGRGRHGKQLERWTFVKMAKPYIEMWLEERKRLGIEHEMLFVKVKPDGKVLPLKEYALDYWTNEFSDIIGEPFYWHALRHYFTTYMIKQGVPSSLIQQIVGWTSADMVNIYDDTDVSDRIGDFFDENGFKEVEKKGLSDL